MPPPQWITQSAAGEWRIQGAEDGGEPSACELPDK